MKKLALMTAGIFLLAPVVANGSQPAPGTPAQAAPKADGAANTQESTATPKNTGQPDAACDTSAKSSSTDTKTSAPSAKVGKDTGEVPPPRKKASSDAACPTPPQ